MLMDTNKDLSEQLKLSKQKKKSIIQSQQSPQVCLALSQSAKYFNTTPKGSTKLYFKAEVNNSGSGSKPKCQHQQLRPTSMEKRGKQKIRRANSGVLRVDKERLHTETNLRKKLSQENSPKPSHQQNTIHSYLARKSKSPKGGGTGGSTSNARARSRKNFSFTTINNFSMQNLVNKNMPNYQTFMNKAYLAGREQGVPPQSPGGHSISGLFHNTSKASGLLAGFSLNQSIGGGGGSRETATPNFQKKLKKYINKRANVLKKAANHG